MKLRLCLSVNSIKGALFLDSPSREKGKVEIENDSSLVLDLDEAAKSPDSRIRRTDTTRGT